MPWCRSASGVARHDPSVTRWYPDVVRLASYPIEEVRNTDAWVMGQDVSSKDAASAGFHEALLKMLDDPSLMVRGNAALSLVRFGDATGDGRTSSHCCSRRRSPRPRQARSRIPARWERRSIRAGSSPRLSREAKPWKCARPSAAGCASCPCRPGQTVAAGEEIATLDPGTDQVWEALRALYLIGQPEDIPAIRPYERELPEIPDHVRQQAVATEQAIRGRAK